MPRPVFYRIDLALLRDKSDTDKAQVPLGPAVVSFFLQGATSSNTSSVNVPVGGSTIAVYDVGDVMAGDVVQVGVDGAPITVTAVNSSTQLAVSNGGTAFTLAPRTRLIPLTRRPELYSDPLGTVPIGPNLLSDANGRAQGYTSRSRYDYIVQANTRDKAELVSVSSSSGAAVNSLTWNHASSGSYRILFVAVTLAPAPDEAIIESVSYAGIPLTLVGETANLKLYRLFEPPVGTYPVVVQLTPYSSGNVVGGAVTAAGVDPTTFVTPATATGSSSLTSVTLNSVAAKSLTLAMVAVADQSTGISVTPGSSQTERWDTTVGTSVPTIVTSAGATKEIVGAGNQALSFILSESRPWQTLATELRYLSDKLSQSRLYLDAVGGTKPSPAWVNARDFSTIQAAIDSLPAIGGVVYLPAGMYSVTSTITIPKNKPVHLVGDGADRTIISCTNANLDILRIKASYTTVENLTIKGAHAVGDGRGIVVGQLVEGTDQPEVMRRVSFLGCRVIDTASWCIYFLDYIDPGGVAAQTLTIWAHVERCEFRNNFTSGMLRVGRGCNGHLYENCGFEFFRGLAVNGIVASSVTFLTCTFEDRKDIIAPPPILPYVIFDGCDNIGLIACWFESHESGNDELHPFIFAGLTLPCQDVRVSGCRFVRAFGNLPRLIHVGSGSKGVLIENPTCILSDEDPDPGRFDGDEDDKDIYTVDGCEVVVAGGIANPTASVSALAIADSTGTAFVGAGPRLTPPKRTTADRDSLGSSARDAKPGDLIFNYTTEGLQFRGTTTWIPFGRVASVDATAADSGVLVTGAGEPGVYRVSIYVRRTGGSGSPEVVLQWWDGEMNGPAKVIRVVPYTFPSSPVFGMMDVTLYNAGDAIAYTINFPGSLTFDTHLRVEAI